MKNKATFSNSNWSRNSVFQLFESVVISAPNNIAITDGAEQLTYQQVRQTALLLASKLANKPEEEPVAIALENGVFFPVAMLACLAVGRPYVGLDLSMPSDRNDLILELSGAKTVIYDSKRSSKPVKISDSVDINDLGNSPLQATRGHKKSIAYIIYTSGSTGKPKGVFQNQLGLLHDVWQYTHSINITTEDHFTLLYSPSVNGAIRDVYGALLNGAILCVYDLRKRGFGNLEAFVSSNEITVFHSIPNIFRTFIAQKPNRKSLENIRLIYLAGDRIYNSDVELYRGFFSDLCRVYIGIGATEVATIYHQWFIDKMTNLQWPQLPVGFAVEDRQTSILREDGTLAGGGEIGEITVESKYVSLGYWKEPLLTKEKFRANGDRRSYCTGDLGMIDETGMLHYLGRNDGMVKKDGHRIETGEIESVILQLEEVEKCGVVQVSDSRQNLVSIVQTRQDVSEQWIKNQIIAKLPSHMIPSRIFRVEEFPQSANFKTNYTEIDRLAIEFLSSESNRNARPDDPFRQVIFDSWAKILGNQSYLENMRWKNAGGTSIEAVNFMVEIEAALNVRFQEDWIRGGEFTPEEIYSKLKAAVKLSEPSKPQLYYFPPIYGLTNGGRNLIHAISNEVDITIINYPPLNAHLLECANWDIFERKVAEQIKQPVNSSVNFLGNCFGGKVLYRLLLKGEPYTKSGFVGIIDCNLRDYSNRSQNSIGFWKVASRRIRKVPLNFAQQVFRNLPFTRKIIERLVNEKIHSRIIGLGVVESLDEIEMKKYSGELDFFANEIALKHNTESVYSISDNLTLVPLAGGHNNSVSNQNINVISKHLKSRLKISFTENAS